MKGNCKVCNEIIFNKRKHSIYCKRCALIIQHIRLNLNQVINTLRRNHYPDLDIKVKVQVDKSKEIDIK